MFGTVIVTSVAMSMSDNSSMLFMEHNGINSNYFYAIILFFFLQDAIILLTVVP